MNPSEWMQEKDTVDSFTEYGCMAEPDPECVDYAEEVLTVKSEEIKSDGDVWTYRIELKDGGFFDSHRVALLRNGHEARASYHQFKWTGLRWARKTMKELTAEKRVVEGPL